LGGTKAAAIELLKKECKLTRKWLKITFENIGNDNILERAGYPVLYVYSGKKG